MMALSLNTRLCPKFLVLIFRRFPLAWTHVMNTHIDLEAQQVCLFTRAGTLSPLSYHSPSIGTNGLRPISRFTTKLELIHGFADGLAVKAVGKIPDNVNVEGIHTSHNNNFGKLGMASCLRKIKPLFSSEPHDVQRPLWWSKAPSSA